MSYPAPRLLAPLLIVPLFLAVVYGAGTDPASVFPCLTGEAEFRFISMIGIVSTLANPAPLLGIILHRTVARFRRMPAAEGAEPAPPGCGLLVLDPDARRILYANDTACGLLGYSPADLSAREMSVLLDPTAADALVSGRPPCRLRHRDGRMVAIAPTSQYRPGDGRLFVYFSPCEEPMETLRQLQDEIDTVRELIDNLPGIFFLLDRDLRLLRWNRNFEALTGGCAGGTTVSPLEFIAEEQRAPLAAKLLDAFEHGSVSAEVLFEDGEGHGVPILFSAVKTRFGGSECLSCLGVDLTERKRAEDRMQRLAHYDTLTGLPNRILFNDRFSRALAFAHRYARELAVLYVDLDAFKQVNDLCGHAAGDAVLRQAAQRISQCLRESDTVARIGGDEFLVLLPEISDQDEARVVAEKILAALAHPMDIGGRTAAVSASVGIAVFPDHGDDPESLVQAADLAMYRAKQAGKNRCRVVTESH